MNLPIEYAILIAIGIAVVSIIGGYVSGYFYMNHKYSNQIQEITDKSNQIINEANEHKDDDKPTLEIDQRIKCTRELLTLIDDTVSLELINNKRYEIFLGGKQNFRDVDSDIEEIAMNVFKSLRPEIFSDKNLVMTEEYLMKYIQKRTFVAVFSYVDKNVTDQVTQNEQA